MTAKTRITADHKQIRRWAEERGGQPAIRPVNQTPDELSGVLLIRFDDSRDMPSERISWERFFARFDQSRLAFVYNEESPSEQSLFYKFVSRNGE